MTDPIPDGTRVQITVNGTVRYSRVNHGVRMYIVDTDSRFQPRGVTAGEGIVRVLDEEVE